MLGPSENINASFLSISLKFKLYTDIAMKAMDIFIHNTQNTALQVRGGDSIAH